MLKSNKNRVYSFGLVVGLVFCLKIFQSTPFEVLFFKVQAGYLIYISLFLVVYFLSEILKGWKIDNSIIYIILMIFSLPVYSALMALVGFEQPFIYGWLSERGWFLLGFSVWLYSVIIKKHISFSSIERIFIGFSLGSLLLFTLISQFFPASALDRLEGFARLTADRGVRFQFQYYFINFGFIYYFVLYMQFNRAKDALLFLLFVAFIVFVVLGRTHMLNVALTLLIYVYFNTRFGSKVKLFYQVVLVGFMLFFIVQIFSPSYFASMGGLFGSMLEALGGNVSSDFSANARIYQMETVFSYWESHTAALYLGAGKISSQWYEGFTSFFGYFYPSDIGLFGGLFLYGILGCFFIYMIPFLACIKLIKKVPTEGNVFIVSMKYMMIFYLVTPQQGSFYFNPISISIPFVILLAYARLRTNFYAR